MLLDLIPLENNRPGMARLRVRKWGGEAEHLELTIENNQRQAYLQADGSWSSSAYWFRLDTLVSRDDALCIDVGPTVVDPLLADTTAVHRVELRSTQTAYGEQQALKLSRSILPSSASGETISSYAFGQLDAPQAPEIPAPVDTVPTTPELSIPTEPEPKPDDATANAPDPVKDSLPMTQARPSGKKWIWIIAAVIALLVAAAAIGFWLTRQQAEPAKPAEPEAKAVAPIADAGGCSVSSITKLGELEFVQGCMKQSPDTKTLFEVINAAKQAGNCGVAQRLYANRGLAGNAQIALAYAREYDPKFHQPNPCFKEANRATAAYWYETVLSAEPDNTEAKQRFEELSE